MNVMDLFRSAPTPAPAATATPAPGATQVTPQTAPNGVVPAQTTTEPAPGATTDENASPLDKFNDLWKTDPNAPNATDDLSKGVFSNLDPQRLMESASKVNFAGAVSSEQLQAIAAGGEGAMKAFQESLNKVAQTVYAQSALATTKIVDQALSKAQQSYDSRIPSMVRNLSVKEGLATENPLLSNPAVVPLVEALSAQFQQKNPNATAAEIRAQVSDYMQVMGQVFNPTKPAAGTKSQQKEEDWSAFLNPGSSFTNF